MGIQQPNETLQAALAYIRRGWNPLPIPFGTKVPIDDGWQQRVIDAVTVAQHFNAQARMSASSWARHLAGSLMLTWIAPKQLPSPHTSYRKRARSWVAPASATHIFCITPS
jgi:hypothetical protein